MTPAVDGAELLDDVQVFIGRFVAFPSPEALVAVTLWAVMTHVAGHLHTTPRLALLSPEPGSGKTRVLEVLALLVAAPMLIFNASAAAIFRTLKTSLRTLLVDEVDAIFTKRGKDGDSNEDLRALLNSGYRRGATIPRCVGPRHDVENFPVFSPVATAGLGELPDTIMSRSIIIRMRKRLRREQVEPFRSRVIEPQAEPLAARIAAWAETNGAVIGNAWPTLPPGVVDRNAELWEPLLAVADAAGGHWPATARDACLALLKVAEERDVTLGVRLLMDLRIVFGDLDAMTTSGILEDLQRLEEAPWGDLYGKPLQPRQLARMLKQYEVKSTKVKVEGRSLQGYRREDLWEAWERYAPLLPAQAEPPEPRVILRDSADSPDTSEVPHEVPSSTSPLEPPEPSVTHEVPQVPEPRGKRNLEERVAIGTIRKVPEVPDSQEGRSDAPPLSDLAAVAARLRDLEVGQVATEYRRALKTVTTVPMRWMDLAPTERPQITLALRLLAAAEANGETPNPDMYLAAARKAFRGLPP